MAIRITNNIILHNTSININGNKGNVDTLNNQMTSQKKIQRPSDAPVTAIRALRLRSTLSEIDQYYEKNIPDAESWLDVTETAITSMQEVIKTIRTQCEYGAQDSLTTDNRKTILTQLEKLRDKVYAEGNADYAGIKSNPEYARTFTSRCCSCDWFTTPSAGGNIRFPS